LPSQLFSLFFTIFAGSLYFFINKVEKDEIEFKRLNKKLSGNIIAEKHQRKEQEQMLLRKVHRIPCVYT